LAVFSLYTENENAVVTMLSHGQTRITVNEGCNSRLTDNSHVLS
jgi:hypothetical protein